MGNAAIWWEPLGGSTVRKIDLGASLSDLVELPPDRWESAQETAGGSIFTTRFRSRERIRLVSSPWLSYDLWDEVSAMVARLRQGGRVSVAEDDASAWAAYALDWSDPDALVMNPGPWAAYGGTVAVGDRYRVTGPSPRLLTEGGVVDTGGNLQFNSSSFRAGGYIVPESSRIHTWGGEDWFIVRQFGFWPCMRLPAEMRTQGAVTHQHRRTFQLEMTLEVDQNGLEALADTPSTLLNGTTDLGNLTMSEQINLNNSGGELIL